MYRRLGMGLSLLGESARKLALPVDQDPGARPTTTLWVRRAQTVEGRGHTPEQVVRKLREAERLLAAGTTLPEVTKQLEISEQTYHRWRAQYGGMRAGDVPPTCATSTPARSALDWCVRLTGPLRERARVCLPAVVAQHSQHETTERSPRTSVAVAGHLLVWRDALRLQELPELRGRLQRPALRVEQLCPLEMCSPGNAPRARR
ncbi:MAG: transposase [Chloroflexi bacterium]|nr:transposase [Chloroflexota bacterium]